MALLVNRRFNRAFRRPFIKVNAIPVSRVIHSDSFQNVSERFAVVKFFRLSPVASFRRRQGFFIIPAVHGDPLVKGGIGDSQFGAPVFDFSANRHFIFSQMKKAAVNIIVVTNDTSIASFVPTSAIQHGMAYAKYFRFSISLPFQVNVVQNFNVLRP